MKPPQDQAERLLHQIKQGEAAAFEQFYERYAKLVYSIAVKMVGDRMEAEDLCHDVFLEVYRTAGQYDPGRGSVEAWLAVKTRSRCLDRLRRKKGERLDTSVEEAAYCQTAAATEETVLTKWERETLRNVMQSIPEAQRQAMYGMYFQSLSHRELSEQMARPLGTVKSLIRYGLLNVKKQLIQLGWLEPSGGAKERD